MLKDASTGNRTSNLLITNRLLYLLYHCRPIDRPSDSHLFLPLVFRDEVEGYGVQGAGHHSKHTAERQGSDDVWEQTDETGAQTEHEVAQEVESLQADVGQQQPLCIYGETNKDSNVQMAPI